MFISKSKANIASNNILSNNPCLYITIFPYNKSYNTRIVENGNRKMSNNISKRHASSSSSSSDVYKNNNIDIAIEESEGIKIDENRMLNGDCIDSENNMLYKKIESSSEIELELERNNKNDRIDEDDKDSMKKVSMEYISGAVSEDLLKLFKDLSAEGRFEAALQLLRGFVKAKRNDILQKLRHKDFLSPAMKYGAVKHSIRFLHVLPRKYSDIRTYNMVANICAKASDLASAIRTADMMQTVGLKLDIQMYTNLIIACAANGEVNSAFKYYTEIKKLNLRPDNKLFSSLIRCCTSALSNKNSTRREELVIVERAINILNDLKEYKIKPDITLWNGLVTCCAKAGQLQKTFEIIQLMEDNNCKPDSFTYTSLIHACTNAEEREVALKILSKALKDDIELNVALFTAGIEACSVGTEASDFEAGLEIFKELQMRELKPDVHFFSALIRLAGKSNSPDVALTIADEMKLYGIEDCKETCSALISSALSAKNLDIADKIYEKMQMKGILPTLEQFNNLANHHGKTGKLGNVISYVSDLIEAGYEPDSYTFTALLCACDRSGQSNLAFYIYEIMKKKSIETDEIICYILMKICYNQLKYLWYEKGSIDRSEGYKAQMPTTAFTLIQLLTNKENVSLEYCDEIGWKDRAITVYRNFLSHKYKPTQIILNRLFSCLRIIYVSSSDDNEMVVISALDLEHYRNRQEMLNKQCIKNKSNFIEDLFDMRAIYLAKEATSLSVLPQLQFTSSVITIDFTNMLPCVSEVYLLTVIESIKLQIKNTKEKRFSLKLKLGCKVDPRKVLVPNYVLKNDNDEKVKDTSYINNNSLSFDSFDEDFDKLEEDNGNVQETIGLSVIAVLRRLKIWHKVDTNRGIVKVDEDVLYAWVQKRLKNVIDKKDNYNSYSMNNGHYNGYLTQQQREIRSQF